jgi:hypothetical protein
MESKEGPTTNKQLESDLQTSGLVEHESKSIAFGSVPIRQGAIKAGG